MPIEPMIALMGRPPQGPSVLDTMQQIQQMGIAREQSQTQEDARRAQIEAQRSLTAERDAKIAADRRAQYEEQSLAALFGSGETIDPKRVYSIVGPQRGAEIMKGITALREQDIKTEDALRAHVGSLVGGILALPEGMRAAAYDHVRTDLIGKNIATADQIPEQYSPEYVAAARKWALTPKDQLEQEAQAARDKIAATTAAAQLPGQVAQSAIQQQVAAGMKGGLTPEQQRVAAQQAAALGETRRHNLESESAGDITSDKVQQRLEQQYRGVLQRTMSSRSGGLGVEDQKVNQAVHLISLFEQSKDAKGNYNIPKAQFAELATGLATLLSPSARPTDSMRQEIETRTAKGDIGGLLTYMTGSPFNGSTQDIYKMLRDSIERQGQVAEKNREGYFDAIRAQAPTDLDPKRRIQLEQALKLNSLSGGKSAGRNVGDVVSVGGQRIKITAIHPDGSFDGTPVK